MNEIINTLSKGDIINISFDSVSAKKETDNKDSKSS